MDIDIMEKNLMMMENYYLKGNIKKVFHLME